MKFLSCLLIALLGISSLRAQQLPKTLLWRITGKDGHHTSYLYGTMHLTDDRVFNLGDSLYAAIAHSDGFAMELDPNALTGLMVAEVQKRIGNIKNLKDLLSEHEYRIYGPRLAKKLGKPMEDITTEDILQEKNKWVTDAYRKGSMPTFLDTYLYDIARRQNKWTGGVEDPEDQSGLLDDAVDESDIRFLLSDEEDSLGHRLHSSSYSSMIDVYADQDLSAIDSMESGLANRDVILIKRNVKMAARMDSLSGVRSMVFAVGAAHLPGEAGLISLLRKRGFDVEPVISDRKIKAKDYVVKELPRTWQKVGDEDSIYQVSMPGTPGDIGIYGVLKMKMYFDLFEGIGYFSTAFQSIYGEKASDSLMDGWARLVFGTKGKKEYKSVDIDGGKGRIYQGSGVDGYKKGMILTKDNMIYMVYAVSIQETEKNIRNADQFIQSFRMLKRTSSRSDPSEMAFVPHIDTVMAYRIATPSPAKPYEIPSASEGWLSRAYISTDMKNGIYFIFSANGVSSDHYIPNDSTYFAEMKSSAMTKVGDIISDTGWMMGDLRVTEFRAAMKQSVYEMLCRYVARGNRWYGMVVMCPREKAGLPEVRRFLSSFELLDYPAHSWHTVNSADTVFSSWCPSPVAADTSVEVSELSSVDARYTSFDSSRSMAYTVTAMHLSPYFWSNSDSAFWAERIKDDISYKDTLIGKRPVKNGDVSGWDWLEGQQGSRNYVRRRALLYGDKLYYLFSAGLRSEVESENTNRFYDDFRFLHPAPASTLFQSKTGRLLKDLQSDDSATAFAARRYMYNAPFTKNDLPLLRQTLLCWKPSEDKEWYTQSLTQRILDLHDSSSFDFAVNSYPAIPDTDVMLLNNLLRLMADFPDSAHYAVLARLLKSHPPAGNLSFTLEYKLGREREFMRPFLSGLLPLLDDSLIRSSMISLAAEGIDSGALAGSALAPYRAMLLKFAESRLRQFSDTVASTVFDKDLVRLLGQFNDPRSNVLLQRFLGIKDNYLRKYALESLLRNKQEPAAAGVRALAADRSYRLDAYRDLKKYGRVALFPADYRTPKAIGAALVREELDEEDDEAVDSIVFVTSLIRDIGDGPQRFYFYRVSGSGEGEESFMACAGPFKTAPPLTAGWYNDDGKAFVLYDKQYDPGQQEEQIEELLAKFKE
ncbi:MAG TPA: TraB/GumN family protein [Puia sp.]|nr:TraB/GumN family protein [Puia sp.]